MRRFRPTWRNEIGLIRAVFSKEIVETLRDRRTIVVALLLPVVMMPIVTLGVPYLSERQQRERARTASVVAVVNRTAAPNLVAMGVNKRLIRAVEVSNPRQALIAREVDAV